MKKTYQKELCKKHQVDYTGSFCGHCVTKNKKDLKRLKTNNKVLQNAMLYTLDFLQTLGQTLTTKQRKMIDTNMRDVYLYMQAKGKSKER